MKKEEKIKTSLYIIKKRWRKLKRMAWETDTTLTDLINKAIKQFLGGK